MKALLWKDLRLNVPTLIAAGAFFAMPYVVVVTWNLLWWGWSMPNSAWRDGFTGAHVCSLLLTQLILAALGANAIASERADRSAEFLFSLPLGRLRVLVSKFVVAVTVAAVLWTGHLVIFGVMYDGLIIRTASLRDQLSILGATGVFLFGASWMGSAFFSTPSKALMLGCGLVATVGFNWIYWTLYFQELHRNQLPPWTSSDLPYVITSLILGIVTFAAGTVYYLRRIEP